jgi:hypothetical protein
MDIEAAARRAWEKLPGGAVRHEIAKKQIDAIAAFGLACYRAGVGDAEGVAREKYAGWRGTVAVLRDDIADAIHRLTEEGGT